MTTVSEVKLAIGAELRRRGHGVQWKDHDWRKSVLHVDGAPMVGVVDVVAERNRASRFMSSPSGKCRVYVGQGHRRGQRQLFMQKKKSGLDYVAIVDEVLRLVPVMQARNVEERYREQHRTLACELEKELDLRYDRLRGADIRPSSTRVKPLELHLRCDALVTEEEAREIVEYLKARGFLRPGEPIGG